MSGFFSGRRIFFHNLPTFSDSILLPTVFLIVFKPVIGAFLAGIKKKTIPSNKRRPTHDPCDGFTRFVITFPLPRYP
ncbi:hypothetical protein DESC_780259 [Desulfosarcina cetonica]|nr:hypothetical protein DESC_780259 [Desulfosarcina cetonica]